jgi:NAD+ diphosphatase
MSAGAPFAFVQAGACDAALDRADHLRNDAAALDRLWPGGRVLLLDADGRAAAMEDGAPCTPSGLAISEGPGGIGAAVFLGLDAEGHGWFALDAALTAFVAPAFIDLRSAAAQWPALPTAAFAQARAMQHWRVRHRHCGVCGAELEFLRGGWLGRCTGCAVEHYPRTDPAVIVAVGDGRRLLLGRQREWPARRYSVVAGFVEPGESLEQAVVREVAEETGLRVRACRYLASQPWPFPGQLMVGFLAEANADDPQVGDELEDARWFDAEQIRAALAGEDDGAGPLLSPSISISRWLMQQWLQEQSVP